MLCPGDARLIEHDAALRGLRVLLDPEAFAGELSRLCGRRIVRATPTYARYKPGTSCLVAFDVTIEPGPGRTVTIPVYARTHAGRDALAKIIKADEQPAAEGPLGAGRFIAETPPLAVFVYPNDHELRALPRLADAAECARLVSKAIGAPVNTPAPIERRRYKPERRLAGRVRDADGGSYFVKLYAEEGTSAGTGNARAVRGEGPLRVPRFLGAHERRGVAVWEWIEGTPLLDERGDPGALEESAALVGRALAHLHRGPAEVTGVYTERCLQELAAESLGSIAAIAPECADRARSLASALGRAVPSRDPAVIHGDFSAQQVLLTGASATLLDFDRAGCGPAELDLGTFLADLERRTITDKLARDVMVACERGLLAGYAEARPAADAPGFAARARSATAFSLLRLAVEPFRERRADWPQLLGALLARAEVLLAER